MVSKNLLAEYGKVSVELEFAQERYNAVRAEVIKHVQLDQEEANKASKVPQTETVATEQEPMDTVPELEPKQEQKPKISKK